MAYEQDVHQSLSSQIYKFISNVFFGKKITHRNAVKIIRGRILRQLWEDNIKMDPTEIGWEWHGFFWNIKVTSVWLL